MKKMLFLIVIAFSLSAKAQQKELFDIDGHLQKLLQEKSGSNNKVTFTPLATNTVNPFSNDVNRTYILGNGDKVISVPGYNMPCVVPDMNQFQTMPNLSGNSVGNNYYFLNQNQPGAIPNGATPLAIQIPASDELLKQFKKIKEPK